jgi:hypothetical protein
MLSKMWKAARCFARSSVQALLPSAVYTRQATATNPAKIIASNRTRAHKRPLLPWIRLAWSRIIRHSLLITALRPYEMSPRTNSAAPKQLNYAHVVAA